MRDSYDICLDYDTLCTIQYKLELIAHDLSNSTEQMSRAIRDGQQFLTGNQFEKAMGITSACVELTAKSGNNIRHAIKYLDKLKAVLEEYGRCTYGGEVVQ